MNIVEMMRGFRIKNRMIVVVFIIMIFQLLLGGAGLWGMARVQTSSELAAALSVDSLKGLDLLRSEMAKVRLLEKEMIILYESPNKIKNSHQKWEIGVDTIHKLTEHFSVGRSESEKAVVKALSGRISAYKARMEPIIKSLEESVFDSATSAHKLSGLAASEFLEADKLLVQLGEGITLTLQASTYEQKQVAFQMQLIFAILLTIGLLLVVSANWINIVAICNPLKLVRLNTVSIAKGDLTQKIEIFGQDEMTDLQTSLENMQGGIAYIVAQVRGSSELISSASQEIAAGNQDLSVRTEQTAKNLQITASAISHLLENVQSTAASAQTANGLAASVSNSAQNCGQVVEQAVLSMQDIAKSSKKINDIIGLIDSIAFQTNILALNAAVEAARAGEQGRGFAVVASEVRALAQRSANAAHEIKVLIMTSVDAVDGGVRLVEQAGTAMRSIVTNAKQVNHIVEEISVASAQQSEGIVQLNQSVHEIDDMTQQNTALVEQSAAAAASLSEQAITLTTLVRQFQTA